MKRLNFYALVIIMAAVILILTTISLATELPGWTILIPSGVYLIIYFMEIHYFKPRRERIGKQRRENFYK